MGLLHRERRVAAADDPVDRERVERGGAETVRERTWTFAPGQLISLIAGVIAIAVGLVALIRAGLDGSLEDPVVEVLRYDHTAWLGLIEIGVGVLLVVAGTGPLGRPLSVLVGVLMVVAGIVVLAEPGEMPDELALEREFGWAVAITGVIVALAALVLPVWRSTTARTDEIDLRERERERDRDRDRDVDVERRPVAVDEDVDEEHRIST